MSMSKEVGGGGMAGVSGSVWKQDALFPLKGERLNIVPKQGYEPLAGNVRKGAIPKLYHGSANPIPAGEIIKPGGPKSKQFAFATKDLRTAGTYAEDRAFFEKQPPLFSVINKVTPVNRGSVYKDITPHGLNTGSYISREGFVSKGPSHWVDYKGNISSMKGPVGTFPIRDSSEVFQLSRINEFKQGTLPLKYQTRD